MSSVISQLTVTRPLPSHCGQISSPFLPVPWHILHSATLGALVVVVFIGFLFSFCLFYICHTQWDDVPLVVLVLPLSSDELLGERWLIRLLDDLHTFLELVVVALVCQFAKLQHTAGLQVACCGSAQYL